MKKKAKSINSEFKKAVSATPDIRNCYENGLQALGSDSVKIHLAGTCEGSVDIDECTTQKYPNANRWDYTFGYKSKAYFVEVHSAYTGEVTVVIAKLTWLKQWLHHRAPELNKIKAKYPFYWIRSNSFHILKQSSQYRQISSAGIMPIARLELS